MFLVTVHDPICSDSGDLAAALYSSFLPIPPADAFPPVDLAEFAPEKVPGAIIIQPDRIVLNKGRERVKLRVTNTGDRPIQVCYTAPVLPCPVHNSHAQVGSHYHFIETNPALLFDRGKAYGKRLDIPAGTAVRFEPGDVKTVTLCTIGGGKVITGGNRLASGVLDPARTDAIVTALVRKGFSHAPEPGALEVSVDTTITRESYVAMYGPTIGDHVRLGDSALWIQVERDLVGTELLLLSGADDR